MNRNFNRYALASIMAAIVGGGEGNEFGRMDKLFEEGIDEGINARWAGIPQHPPPPPGTKEYFFNAEGVFSTEQMRRDEMVFYCCAINDKNAERKFKQWKKEQLLKHNP